MDGWQDLCTFASATVGQHDNPRLRQSLLKQRKTIVFHTLDDGERVESFGMLIETVHKEISRLEALIERYHSNNKQTNSLTFCI